jgi:hypothetical protein
MELPIIQDASGHLIKRAVVDGNAITATFDPNAKRILEENEGIRNSGIVEQKGDMHWALSMTQMQHAQLCRRYPDLASHDGEIHGKAWKKFLASSESKPYRVT